MPLGTVKLFRDAIYYALKWHPLFMVLMFILSGHGYTLAALRAGRKFDTSPLDINYWSTTPYAFGVPRGSLFAGYRTMKTFS